MAILDRDPSCLRPYSDKVFLYTRLQSCYARHPQYDFGILDADKSATSTDHAPGTVILFGLFVLVNAFNRWVFT